MQEMQETLIRSLGQENPLEKGMQPTAVFLPGESHEQRSLAQSTGLHRDGHDWRDLARMQTVYM